MTKMVRSLAAIALTFAAAAACSSAATAPPGEVVHRGEGIEVRTHLGTQGVKSGGVTIQNAGCSCGDADWCNNGYPHNDTQRGFDCSEGGNTYACLCDCSWDCVPVD